MKIQFLNPQLTGADIKAVTKVLKSGWLTAWNPVVGEFETAFAKYLGAKEAVVMSSGTAALHVALLALGVGKGDEVITTPLSWVASSNAILYVGAKPIFVDIEPDTGLINASKIEAVITRRTKAILPVHLYGQMANMRAIKRIAKKHKLFVVEDACHAIESKRDSVRPGELSDIACFSFHAAKNITSGEGGAAATNNRGFAKAMRVIAEAGVKKGGGKRTMVCYGYKYSFTAFQTALLLSQLKRIKSIHRQRKEIFNRYQKLFKKANNPRIALVRNIPKSTHAYHLFVVKVPQKIRDKVRRELAKAGIGTDVHFNPIHLEPYYREILKIKKGAYPIAESFGYSEISLPTYPALTSFQQNRIVRTLSRIINEL